MCGENRLRLEGVEVATGSSPRVRGKRTWRRGPGRRSGLIPACAGKTGRSSSSTGCPRAHPRVCGENDARRSAFDSARGSSPRVRGKLIAQPRPPALPRLIPACAGKTVRVGSTSMTSGAHPRVCGENVRRTRGVWEVGGSSPRVRGKRLPRLQQERLVGLIPACAGKTSEKGLSGTTRQAHPRVCGENRPRLRRWTHEHGSSPRVRGKLDVLRGQRPRPGLIPACAGKTWTPDSLAAGSGAHPRVCGENVSALGNLGSLLGSSPRVRGKHHLRREGRNRRRLIPACAGKTGVRAGICLVLTAHPRVCGENWRVRVRVAAHCGSSPRVRGKPRRLGGPLPALRLIPACAGKTTPRTAATLGRSAHPRVCGENHRVMRRSMVGPGSSPRVRGKRPGGL